MSASVKTRVVESLVDLAVDICIRELGTVTVMDVFVLICLFLNLALATNSIQKFQVVSESGSVLCLVLLAFCDTADALQPPHLALLSIF